MSHLRLFLMSFLTVVAMGHAEEALWTNPRCCILEANRMGHLVELGDGRIMTVTADGACTSRDEGNTWSEPSALFTGAGPGIPRGGLLLRTRDGVVILVYADSDTKKWGWSNEEGKAIDDARLDVWAIRSLDEGRTWVDRQRIFEGYCGALISIIQASSGHVVVPVQRLLRNPDRHGTATYVSDDNGKTWKRSNIIDLGGHGHHDGAFEATLTELRDGRLWMLLRTNWDRFWEAFSEDHGLSWRVICPTSIDSSSSPGFILRLKSGRLVLAWNRLYPEGQTTFPRRDDQYSEHPASWQRDELSIAFSADDGKTWSKPVVIARKKNANLSYPYIFERSPGLLWLYSGRDLRVSFLEKDFAGIP